MRLLSRLLIVLVTCLLAIAPLALPAEAQDGASIHLSPSSGVPGTEVTVYGYNFTADELVGIYYYLDATDSIWRADVKADGDGDFRVTFEVPESYKGAHTVLAKDAEDTKGKSASRSFTVRPGLFVSPAEGPVGTTITVTGRGFAKDETGIEVWYYLNGTYETIPVDDDADAKGSWEASFRILPSARGSHDIRARGDDSSLGTVSGATFRVMPWINILDGPSGSIVEEPSGSPGESITMTGSGFYAGDRYIKILFEGEETETEPEIIRADDEGYWEASFKVPEMSRGEYSVTAEGELTKKEDISPLDFEIEPGLVLSPGEGHVGMNLTVAGHGFDVNKDVVIMYEDEEQASATTDAEGSFETSFIVPESRHGARLVTAEDAEGNEGTAIFTMESDPPPTPELISPADGGRAGFIGKVRPTFEWTEVDDPSGVYYSLQISASANVTDTGEFVDPVVSQEGLVGTNYTLAKAEGLPYGTYYWIVQAVDGAENAGNWTAAYSFRAGVMPLWAFILIMVAIAAGIGTAVYFFIIRQRMYY